EGQLVNDQGTEVKLVFTVHDGMGVFSFLPEPGRSYSVRDASGKLHPLPPPAEEGGSLQLLTRSGRYYVSALGFGGGTANLLLRDATELRPIAEIDLDGKAGAIMLEREFCRPGINHLLLLDPRGRILAERLFFVRDYDAPACSVDVERFTAVPGDPVRATVVLVKPDGTPLDGNCSVSVVRGALKDWRQGDGIVSYMGLSSELKGRINDPCYYFDPKIPEPERDVALDLLMMIQGWRYYDLERITGINEDSIKIKYLRERVQELRGHISRRLSSRMPKNFIFTFLIPQQNILQSVEVARGRRFVIDSLDFQENTGMLINIGSSRLGAHYLPKWDGDPAAGPYIYKPAPGFAGSLKLPEPLQSETMRGDTLAGAVVTASYTEDDVLVFGRSYREDLLTFKDMTLVEDLSMTKAMFEYDGEYMYNRSRKRNRSAYDGRAEESDDSWDTGEENDSGRVKLIVEDSEEEWWSFDMLRLEDLRSLSISTQPDPVYGGDGGVVHIVVKPGGLRRDTDRNPSLLYFVPLGYQATRYFEAAGYIQGESGVAGKRNTVWWSPDVPVSQGRGVFEFRNDNSCDYPFLIRIEGIDTEGRPFSCHSLVSPE
ncbi:MAG: hypothetical protein IKH11_10900, partial [Bacteroidales bacterium]|nr:hypothetical protein [Bacteroidales bacterium]